MEIRLKPDLQAKLDQLAQDTGRPAGELVEDAVAGYVDELAQMREMLDRRINDLDSGRVTPVDGEEAFRLLRQKNEARRRRSA